MLKHYQRLTLGLVLLINVAAVVYSAYIVWLSAIWILDLMDLTLPILNWIFMAVQLVAAGVVRALLGGAVLFGINALLLRLVRISSWRIPLLIAGAAIAVSSGAASIGGVLLVIHGALM